MKNFLQICLLFCSIAMVTITGCKKEDDEPARDKFLGSYTVTEACSQTGNAAYSISITASTSNDDAIVMTGFGNFAATAAVTATVNGDNLTIAAQTLTINGIAVNISNGTGAINDNLLTITYTYSVQGGGESCTSTCTKL